MQADLLDQYPELDIRVYAVWFNMLPGDHRGAWDPALLPDLRVSHFWDEGRTLGRSFADFEPFGHGAIAWDIYYLFAENAAWTEAPKPILDSGYTIFGQRERLRESIMGLINEQ